MTAKRRGWLRSVPEVFSEYDLERESLDNAEPSLSDEEQFQLDLERAFIRNSNLDEPRRRKVVSDWAERLRKGES
jgi:hypothetical protein